MALMPYDDALEQLINGLPEPTAIEAVALEQALQRVLAQGMEARMDAPRFDNSAMDGYAVCGLNAGSWQLIDAIAAGDATAHVSLQAGEAVRILTGAAVPSGTEAVIAQEDVEVDGKTLRCDERIRPKQHIRFQAEEYAQGDCLLHAHQSLSATAIGVIASQGLEHVNCFRALNIAVFSSGNELQPVGSVLKDNQIFDSNRLMLLNLLKAQGYASTDGGILPDDLDITRAHLQDASRTHDVVLISGGASVGDKDYTKEALQQLGQVEHWKLAIKPGKPFGWGKIGQTQVFVLPGNPVASWVTFLTMVAPALAVLSGVKKEEALPKWTQAAALFHIDKAQSRQQFLRGVVSAKDGHLQAQIHANQGSHMLAACASSNALIVIPAGSTVAQGDSVNIMYLPIV